MLNSLLHFLHAISGRVDSRLGGGGPLRSGKPLPLDIVVSADETFFAGDVGKMGEV